MNREWTSLISGGLCMVVVECERIIIEIYCRKLNVISPKVRPSKRYMDMFSGINCGKHMRRTRWEDTILIVSEVIKSKLRNDGSVQ